MIKTLNKIKFLLNVLKLVDYNHPEEMVFL